MNILIRHFSAPLLPIRKKDNILRLCVDYRKLNQVTCVQQKLMPNPEDLFPKLARVKVFIGIDLSKGYWQINLHSDSKPLTAFSSQLGNMHLNKLPFCLSGAPNTSTKLMRKLTFGRKNIISYLDDILLFHTNLDKHLTGLKTLLETICRFGLTIRP